MIYSTPIVVFGQDPEPTLILGRFIRLQHAATAVFCFYGEGVVFFSGKAGELYN